MLILAISPVLAFACHYISQKIFLSKKGVSLIIAIVTLPSLIIWMTGYDYSDIAFHWFATMLIIMSIFWGIFTIIHERTGLKFAIAIVGTLPIIGIVILASIGASFGGGEREVINEAKFNNYIALELEPKLYEKEKTLIVNKTQLFGFIEKTILETWFTDTSFAKRCKYYVEDKEILLVYNLCEKRLTSE